jgi:ParB/RepB/Spo0J family partition protein
MQSTTLTHAKLRLSESNVRKANGDAGLEALAASIAEHGLLQPLIVSPSAGKKTLYDVHAGGRRWRAIGLLIERGVLPKDYAIDVRLCENEDAAAREISLAENLIREAMTPADEARLSRHRRWRRRCRSRCAPFRRDGPPCAGPPAPCRSGRADLRRAGCGRDHARCRTGLWLDR